MMQKLSQVTVIGTGLIGTSVALALREHDVAVRLSDHSPGNVRDAVAAGAGTALSDADGPADLAVIAVPPSSTARVLRASQQRGLARVYTDVASVKSAVVAAAREAGCDMASFVPGHPLAGGHQSGPQAARADLFADRVWAVCAGEGAADDAMEMVVSTAELTGSVVCLVDPAEHDRAVAVSSHVPHIVSSALAALFADTSSLTLRLAGQGVLDATRIAAGDPALWADIAKNNSVDIAGVLSTVRDNLTAYISFLLDPVTGQDMDTSALIDLLAAGNRGRDTLLHRQ
jgi:prephenate dehydrogenase